MSARKNDEESGLSWADQWDSHSNSNGTAYPAGNKDGKEKNKKLAEYEEKVKAAASAGFVKAKSAASVGAEKAKVVATVGAQKVKAGTATGVKWIKDQYQKRTQK